MKKSIFLIILIFPAFIFSQDEIVFSFEDFIALVRNEHPLSRSADLQTELGQLEILKSKGGADPKVFTQLDQKNYDEERYYSLLDAGLKIPTWYGVSFQTGFEQNNGSQLNPENKVPENGLFYAGLNLPVGKGLFMDDRRAALRKAQIYSNVTEAEQKAMLNNLILESGGAYWNWYNAFNNYLVFEDAFQLTKQRFDAVVQGAILGDRPSIDTLEAGIQLQTRKVLLRQAKLELDNSRALLSVFLWEDGVIPLELDENTVPSESDKQIFSNDILLQTDSLVLLHPDYSMTQFKLESLGIDKRLNKEMLKPQVDLKYNLLSNTEMSNDVSSLNDYTFGLQFSMPLFLRKERGDLKMTNVKIQQTEFELDQKEAMINYKIEIALNEWRTTIDLIEIQKQTVRDYKNLLSGERSLFESGESSLFMVNSREMMYIQSQLKLNELMTKQYESQLKVSHSLGILYQLSS